VIRLKKYTQFESVIPRESILNDINKKQLAIIASKSEVFYNSNLTLRQGGYLTPCSLELFGLLNNTYKSINKKDIPYSEKIIFQNGSLSDIFRINILITSLKEVGFIFSPMLVKRYIASLLTKPFVILTGLSGSGKTKLAQAFVQWICQDEDHYRIVPVGADWTNREPLLGYPNALKPEEYVKPDSGVLDLIIQANQHPDLPYFLILDEMNLSHVERYFADFLSVMESKEEIPLYAEGTVQNGVPAKLKVPSNLFIIGTVNIDETTNMFSPKVLDRANTIEFRVTQDEMKNFLGNIKSINMDALTGKGAGMAKSFLDMSANNDFAIDEEINAALIRFFAELKKTGAEFGYRSATEILRLINQLTVLDNTLTTNQKIDIAIMQKLLPKLHGSRRKLVSVLETLGSFCVNNKIKVITDVFGKDDFDFENHPDVVYRLSLEKIARMHKGAIDNGFASFAEA
jgi:5-methylcytosine-specific restriction protein B